MRADIRRTALVKIATLSAAAPAGDAKGQAHLTRLCKKCPQRRLAALNGYEKEVQKVPMMLSELEIILALCEAAPLIQDLEPAERLFRQLSPYLLECYVQTISDAPGLREIEPSPWEILTSSLTSALLSLGQSHAALHGEVKLTIESCINGWANTVVPLTRRQFDEDGHMGSATDEDVAKTMTLTISLLGFLDAAAQHASFWDPQSRLELVETIRSAMREEFMVAVEAAQSIVRNARPSQRRLRIWKRYTKHYAAIGRPLGAMILHQGFTQFVRACAALLITPETCLTTDSVLEYLQRMTPRLEGPRIASDDALVEGYATIATREMDRLQNDLDYLQRVGSAWQQRLAATVTANALTTYLCCTMFNEDIADSEVLMNWLDAILSNQVQIADPALASTVLQSMAVLARRSQTIAVNLSRTLPRVIVQGGLDSRTTIVAAACLTSILKHLPQDATITTMYSLGNVLSAGGAVDRNATPMPHANGTLRVHRMGMYDENQGAGSAISLAPSDVDEPSHVYSMVIQTIVEITRSRKDEQLTALALSMLIQKIGRVNELVDADILIQTALLGKYCGEGELRSLLKLYARLCRDALIQDNPVILQAVMDGRNKLSEELKVGSPHFEIYLVHLLDTIVSKGDAHESDNKKLPDVEFAAKEIAQLLPPLATLCKTNVFDAEAWRRNENIMALQRNAWFNVVAHGFTLHSELTLKYREDLRVLARRTQPLIVEERADQVESDVELNTVLRRGKGQEHTNHQKKILMQILPNNESDIRSLSYSEAVFLNTACLVEELRASAGDFTKTLAYFLDPKLRSNAMGNCMLAIALNGVRSYLDMTLAGTSHAFSTPYLARQLATIFAGCCHRIGRVQQVATACADLIIKEAPSTLCQKTALFALLELLSIMWSSCLEGETDEYDWTPTFTSSRESFSVELSDDYEFRRMTLNGFYRKAKAWVAYILDIAPLDIKGLLQTYLSEYDDETAYGHVSLGRSFALEMGSIIPSTDQRLGAIGREDQPVGINTASDFIAQYTTRQEYRFIDGLSDQDEEWLRFGNTGDLSARRNSALDRSIEDATKLLAEVEFRTLRHKIVPIVELRDILRRAAALLCRVKKDQCALVNHLVGVPFAVFTKQSIKLGISLWMSVIKENPMMESRILVAIAQNFENTIRSRRGLFSKTLHHLDPFFVKQEFAPSDKEANIKRRHHAYNIIAPHFRLVQFLASHFSATRLSSPHTEKIYHRLMLLALGAIDSTTDHPLARETHMHLVLLALRFLQHSTCLGGRDKWRLKDLILSAGLRWFARSPKWSYGGNRLQLKAETHVLADIQLRLQYVSNIGIETDGSLRSLQPKQELLNHLLANEQTRLMVWLFPLDYERRHHFTAGHQRTAENAVIELIKTAWAYDPLLAVHLVPRFHSPKLKQDVRWLVQNFPEKVLHDPDALELLLGSTLPPDVSWQLKYMLYWAPVNPVTAVTYFLPAYGNHPFIIQYAMRALESHSVDVTFFYVPQVVQALRYDVLGYVERYIIETAKFSQLFAHQIIWNMKANMYKDEDSQIPDPVKPTLDHVTDALISSFSDKDMDFYKREFEFFDEVTGISGKLKPFIKRPKPEKKQKIEEELRKIKVEVGVYLPSNPDGVVIGIDRKSGKPLQSHAKAPYMATFRIRKQRGNSESIEEGLEEGQDLEEVNTYEVWQSAIFKVGDDCRQDVLALQMIAAFRGIFNNVGLDCYVYPYRVTATAPGCGVIDVLPNSISRDMLGREAVNGLYDYFISKYGSEDSIRFQEARNNFVKSMAAYSLISYLLQFKDRHNGNIMIDDAGHILHIDFGFCFDIAPGGVKFERAPFKLTAEMVAVMGGSTTSQPFRWFEELCIKAFLASRQHCEHLAHIVMVMLDSGLPCFKPETIQHFKERFVLEKTDREAADFMRELVKKSYNNMSTKGYDQFQLLTNGIPY